MTESMKFGPEWLRNLSGDSCNSGVGGGGGGTASLITPRYQLAEHRYGREEMLALFDRNCKPPESLVTQQNVYSEKTQLPLAFIPMTDDETRSWSSGPSNAGRGRGGSVDRGGRGRTGRGGTYTSHYTRSVGFDDSGDGSRLESQPYPTRNRVFDRSQSERGWSERNGVVDPGEWNGSTSPRKELGRGTSGGLLMEGNWRRHRGAGDDEEGWRAAITNRGEKWGRGSWRDGSGPERERLDRSDGDIDENRGGGRWETRPGHRSSHDPSHHHPQRTARAWDSSHHDNHDNLPEWATENPSESGGSFDASGAFHGGMFSDDDEEGHPHPSGAHEMRIRRISEGNNGTTKLAKAVYQPQNASRHTNSSGNMLARERPKSLHPFDDKEPTMPSQERRSISPTKQPNSASNNLPKEPITLTNSTPRRVPSVANIVKSEHVKIQGPQRSKSFIDTPTKTLESRSHVEVPSHKPLGLHTPNLSKVADVPRSAEILRKPDDDLDRMKEEADMLVAKLMADEESHREEGTHGPPASNQGQPLGSTGAQEKWFYRDPQGEVQGPFLANEMAEWCKAGYFTSGLLVRRTCDERYATLGDLMKMCGRVPFTAGPPIPPLKLAEQIIQPIPNTVTAGLPSSALPKPPMEDPLLLLQYSQLRLLQDQMLLRQAKNSAISKLSQREHWPSLSQVEQNHLVMQLIMQDIEVREIAMNSNPFSPPMASAPTNPVMQLFSQMQQAKTPNENHVPPNPNSHSAPVHSGSNIDPVQHIMQQMGGMPNIPGPPQPSMNAPPAQPSQEDDPIKSLLRQLQVNSNGHHPMDSIWPHPPPQINPQFNAQNWLQQVGPLPPVPPGQMPNFLWDLHTKEMKTEQQILEEQNIKTQDDRKREELRKHEELIRKVEDENVKRKNEEEQVRQLEDSKRKEDEKKRREEEKRRKEDEKRNKEEELRKKEEKKRKEEERKREEKRKLDEENNRKKQEEEKKRRDEVKRQEEKLRKEEEKKKKIEEEQKRLEEEKLKKEEEARKKIEQEEQARRAEQRRREAEALKKLQERSKAPWAQAPHAPQATNSASLAEIQRLEREMKVEEQRYQQLMQQQMAQQKAVEAAKEAAAAVSSRRLQFKWAEKAASAIKQPQVKSLAQIQQEEQEQISKVKQQEKEKQEKAFAKETTAAMQNTGIWGTASQSLSWAASANIGGGDSKIGNKAWVGSGFWDEPVPSKPAPVLKPQPPKPVLVTAKASSTGSPPQQNQQNNKTSKSKSKKEEDLVKKLFENSNAKGDDFTQWCFRTLCGLQSTVDIPTFVGFLTDIESAYEVKEYVRMYLGDNKQTTEFVKQFLEKRSKLRSAQRPQAEADDLCKPAPAVNPNAPTEFQEVKGKTKKPKKGKMFKVDNRILGFSVTAATDRINVGDRDYGEGV